jgi:integrase
VARKNGNGEGSRPGKRTDGRWEVRYWPGGKRQSVCGKTRKEAAEKLAKAIAAQEEAPAFVPSNITVGVFVGRRCRLPEDQ